MVPVTLEIEAQEDMPSYSYAIKNGRISGFVDDKQAVVQSIYKRLMTERYSHEIYTSDYGIQTEDIFQNGTAYAKSVIEERIREALENDERIESVSDFEIIEEKGSISVQFNVLTVFGKGEIELIEFMEKGD